MKCRILSFLLLLGLFAEAQPAQIAIIDFFGLKKLSEQDIRKALPIKEGDSIQKITQLEVFAKLRSIPGVHDASISTVCCDDKDGKWIVFIGIAENATNKKLYNPLPSDNIFLPTALTDVYDQFMKLVMEGVSKGEGGQESSEGHALLTYLCVCCFGHYGTN